MRCLDPATGLLYFCLEPDPPRIVVPDNQDLRSRVLGLLHGTPLAGHPGAATVRLAANRQFFWKGMHGDIKDFVARCQVCQRTKKSNVPTAGPYTALPVPSSVFEVIGTDVVGGFPEVTFEGRAVDSILTFVCHLSRACVLVPVHNTLTSASYAELLVRHVALRFGMPKIVVSDRGSIFTSGLVSALADQLGVELRFTTSYRPQANGLTELQHQKALIYLRSMVNYDQQDWASRVAFAEFALNTTPQLTLDGATPFDLVYGRRPVRALDGWSADECPPELQDMARAYEATVAEARDALALSKLRDAVRADTAMPRTKFNVGSLVLVNKAKLTAPLSRAKEFRKLDQRFVGPFPISELLDHNLVRIELPAGCKANSTFNIDCLRLYVPDDWPDRPGYDPQPPLYVDHGVEMYEVKAIHGTRGKGANRTFLTEWVGYPNHDYFTMEFATAFYDADTGVWTKAFLDWLIANKTLKKSAKQTILRGGGCDAARARDILKDL